MAQPRADHHQKLQRAMTHHRAGRLPQAETLYREILAENPTHPDALHMLGLLTAQAGRNDLAADLLDLAIAAAPDQAILHGERAEICRRLGQLDAAADHARKAIALQPTLAAAHYTLGIILQQQHRFEDALASYDRAAALEPANPNAPYNRANTLRDSGRLEEALASYQQFLARFPDHADAHGNLGLALQALGRLDDALACYRRVLALRPDDATAHNSLGTALAAQGRREEALAAYRQAIALNPDYALAHNNLGKALQDSGLLSDAVESYRRAVALKPDRAEPYQNLGLAFEKIGLPEEALPLFREALSRGVADPEARYHMAAAVGAAAPPSAPPSYVTTLFDQFADTFDHHMVDELRYHAPELLYQAVRAAVPAATLGDILDLGCGTGLCGPLFAPRRKTLTGIDLSPAMLEKARARGVYDHLHVADLTEFLDARPAAYDLLLAADVFVYLGDLAGLFAAARTALRPGGLFAFSVESLESPASPGYFLRPTRRYAHAAPYLRALAAAHGFAELSLQPAPIRLEGGQPVPGLIVLLQSTAANEHPLTDN